MSRIEQRLARLKAEGRLTDEKWWLRRDHDAGSPYYIPTRMTREELREGWVRAWTKFYSPRSIWDRFTVRRASSWIQIAGFLPLNFMQNRLAHLKIAGGQQRFRAGVHIEDDAPRTVPERAAPAAPSAAPAQGKQGDRRTLPIVS